MLLIREILYFYIFLCIFVLSFLCCISSVSGLLDINVFVTFKQEKDCIPTHSLCFFWFDYYNYHIQWIHELKTHKLTICSFDNSILKVFYSSWCKMLNFKWYRSCKCPSCSIFLISQNVRTENHFHWPFK